MEVFLAQVVIDILLTTPDTQDRQAILLSWTRLTDGSPHEFRRGEQHQFGYTDVIEVDSSSLHPFQAPFVLQLLHAFFASHQVEDVALANDRVTGDDALTDISHHTEGCILLVAYLQDGHAVACLHSQFRHLAPHHPTACRDIVAAQTVRQLILLHQVVERLVGLGIAFGPLLPY